MKWDKSQPEDTYLRLTPAERETYRLAQKGMTRMQIATAMGVKLNTVHARMATVLSKIEAGRACAYDE